VCKDFSWDRQESDRPVATAVPLGHFSLNKDTIMPSLVALFQKWIFSISGKNLVALEQCRKWNALATLQLYHLPQGLPIIELPDCSSYLSKCWCIKYNNLVVSGVRNKVSK